jgi:hypothetical protein
VHVPKKTKPRDPHQASRGMQRKDIPDVPLSDLAHTTWGASLSRQWEEDISWAADWGPSGTTTPAEPETSPGTPMPLRRPPAEGPKGPTANGSGGDPPKTDPPPDIRWDDQDDAFY